MLSCSNWWSSRDEFEPGIKKELPTLPRQVAVITSPQGAAIRDIQSTFARRFAGIELVKDKSSRERLAPDSAGAIYCRNVAIENGLMLRATGDAMIMSPPLICNQDEIDSLVDKLAIALDQTAKHYSVTG